MDNGLLEAPSGKQHETDQLLHLITNNIVAILPTKFLQPYWKTLIMQ